MKTFFGVEKQRADEDRHCVAFGIALQFLPTIGIFLVCTSFGCSAEIKPDTDAGGGSAPVECVASCAENDPCACQALCKNGTENLLAIECKVDGPCTCSARNMVLGMCFPDGGPIGCDGWACCMKYIQKDPDGG